MNEITICKGIKIYNKFFSLLRRFYDLCKIISGSRAIPETGDRRAKAVVLERICRILKFSTFREKKLR